MTHQKIKTTTQLAKEAFSDLKKFQSGERNLIRTGRPFIDKHIGGMLPSSLYLLGSFSGVGKTTELIRTIEGILNTDLNPKANNFVTLEYSLEMKFLDLVIRGAHDITGKKKSEVISTEFTEEEKKLVNDYYNGLSDGRRFVIEESINTREFLDITDQFCAENASKDAIIITIDHLLLITAAEKGEDPLERVATHTNYLRKKYNNVYFIYLSQLNRSNYANIKDNSNLMVPTAASIYGSSHFEFLSSYVVVITNPFKLGVNEYMRFRDERYPELFEYMTPQDAKGYSSFNTIGCIYYHLVKLRDSDYPYDNLWIESLGYSEETLQKMKLDSERESITQTVQYEMPTFGGADF